MSFISNFMAIISAVLIQNKTSILLWNPAVWCICSVHTTIEMLVLYCVIIFYLLYITCLCVGSKIAEMLWTRFIIFCLLALLFLYFVFFDYYWCLIDYLSEPIMVKLTPDLIGDCRQFINPVKDRELDLRGHKIPAIESMGATYNQFDTIDLSNNDIKVLENIPLMHRLKTLILNNNRVCTIQPDLGANLVGLETLVLTNNNVNELGDIDPLAKFPKLQYLTLMGNPVTHKPQYRSYVIYRIPHLRVLDFRRIKQEERNTALSLFKGKKGKSLKEAVVKKTVSSVVKEDSTPKLITNGLPAEDVLKIKEAISAAKSLQEVENLQQMLQAGHVPGKLANGGGDAPAVVPQPSNEVEMEEEEEEV